MHRSNDGKMKKMEFMTINIKEIFRNYVKRNNNQPGLNSSAVLVPIYYRDGWPFILFTQRSNQVIHHKGQICFPGGKQEENDRDLLHTALREAEEEIGLHSSDTDIVGELEEFPETTNKAFNLDEEFTELESEQSDALLNRYLEFVAGAEGDDEEFEEEDDEEFEEDN